MSALQNVPKVVPDNVPDNVPKDSAQQRQLNLLHALKTEPHITVKALAQALNCTEKTIKRDLEKLKTEHKIKRIGSSRAGYWQLIDG